jgi:hypothetical protein
MPWTSGAPEDDTYYKNNVAFARQMAHHVHKQIEDFAQPKAGDVGRSFAVPAMTKGKERPPDPVTGKKEMSQVQSLPIRTKMAATMMGGHEALGKHVESASQKVPTFDVALAAGHGSRWARRQAAQAYTVDTHMQRAQGITSKYQNWSGSATPGGYDIAALTGRRAGREVGRLPAHFQENVWVGARPPAPVQQQMFKEKSKKDKTLLVTKAGRAARQPRSRRGNQS